MAETYSAGIVTAYGAAVRGGYTGTYEQWCQDMANLGDNVAEVRTKAAQAAQSAGNAAGSATAAAGSAGSAAGSASEAASSAGKAEDAQGAAETAQGKAEEAQAAAETAQGKAEDAQTAAETAQGKAEDAQEAAEQAQSDAEAAAQSVSQSADQISQNASDISDLKSALNTVCVSGNVVVNGIFKELFLVGISADSISKLSVNTSSSGCQFIFKDSDSVAIATFNAYLANGEVIVSRDASTDCYMYAYINWAKVQSLSNLDVTFNSTINNLSANPVIEQFAINSNKTVFVPTYTRTSGKRISTRGEIADAGSSWFYTSPIQVYAGDVVCLRSYGAASAAPICFTDSTGSSYTPAVSYGGLDPSVYYLPILENGYIAVSGYSFSGNDYSLVIFRNTYISNIINPLNTRIENAESDIENIRQSGSSEIAIDAVDYGIKMPKPIKEVSTDAIDGWHTENGAALSLTTKYNNIIRQKEKCVTVTSATGNGYAYFELPSSVNANQYPLLVEICLGEYDSNDNPAGNFAIEVFSGTGRDSSYKITYVVQGNTNDSIYNPVYNRNGWFSFCLFIPSIPESERFVNGSRFDPTDVRAVGIHLYNNNNIPVVAHVARMAFVPAMQKPGIITIVDNFGLKVPDMADYAYSKGVRLNLSVIPGFYAGETTPTCASKSELDRIATQGHCIWNHTWTHAILNNLTFAEIQDQVNYAEKWMVLNGYGENCKFVSNPSARFNTHACNSLLDSNAKMIFHVWSGRPKAVFVPYYPTLRCIQTTLLDQEVSSTMTPAQIAEVASKCMTYGGITVLGFHDTYWDLDNGDSWKAYIDAIAAIQNVYHYGLDEIYNGQWC